MNGLNMFNYYSMKIENLEQPIIIIGIISPLEMQNENYKTKQWKKEKSKYIKFDCRNAEFHIHMTEGEHV